ncbi:MAG: DNA-binding transcriptional repressor PuuR [Deltaproteobacteria bacterium ADurb.Bin151]|nr:MAG: DNA-binding transcriptional repressor PuuR [Deltaproteobacteria bacterium ADurb.Bin151]
MIKKADESFGGRIRRLREAKGISLETLSHDTGYTVKFLKEIEEDKTPPPVAVVLQLGRVFKVDVDQLQENREKEAAKRRRASHRKRVSSYAYTPLTAPGKDKHLRAYRVTIDPETEHEGVEYHHEGEEFIYVLQGGLTISVGQNTSKLKTGQSLSFDSSLSHKLSNPTRQKTELLVVIYLP